MSEAVAPVIHAFAGVVDYGRAFRMQSGLAERRKAGELGDAVLMLEHPHTYTLGTRGRDEDILLDGAGLATKGVEVVRSNRGGEATYHGPGQLVAYPILNLHGLGLSVVEYVRLLEGTIRDTAADFGVETHCMAGKPGVFTTYGGVVRKIAAIGVRVSRGVTMHGFALNVEPDLSYFNHIVPCGTPGMEADSIAARSGASEGVAEVAERAAGHLGRRLGRMMERVDAGQMIAMAA